MSLCIYTHKHVCIGFALVSFAFSCIEGMFQFSSSDHLFFFSFFNLHKVFIPIDLFLEKVEVAGGSRGRETSTLDRHTNCLLMFVWLGIFFKALLEP